MNYMKSNIYLKLAYKREYTYIFGVNTNTLFLELMVIPYFFSNTFGVNGK